jgi:adenosylcobinamide-GDP ribazoletransferase
VRLLPDSLRLAFGTLTILPVKPPTHVDRDVAGWAMTFAPLVGLVLAALVGVPLWFLIDADAGSPFLLAALTIGALAWLTRAMHLDGLADVADGLGSGRRGEDALAIMKKSDIGPFGVATLLLVLLIQVTALATCISAGYGVIALGLALIISRLMISFLCRKYAAARADGLGSLVAHSVSRGQEFIAHALTWAGIVAVIAATHHEIGRLGDGLDGRPVHGVWGLILLIALVAPPRITHRATRRFGGATGDLYGAGVEIMFTSILVALALAA